MSFNIEEVGKVRFDCYLEVKNHRRSSPVGHVVVLMDTRSDTSVETKVQRVLRDLATVAPDERGVREFKAGRMVRSGCAVKEGQPLSAHASSVARNEPSVGNEVSLLISARDRTRRSTDHDLVIEVDGYHRWTNGYLHLSVPPIAISPVRHFGSSL